MSSSIPLEEEGLQLRTQIVSPVSPKPLRFPNPSSLPVLENQMDPEFNDTATHLASHKSPDVTLQRNVLSAPTQQTNSYNSNTEMNETQDGQASAGSDTDYGMSVDSNSSDADNQATSAVATYSSHHESAEHAPLRPSDVAAPDDADSAASPDSDLYEDDPPSNVVSVPSNPEQNEQSPSGGTIETSNSILDVTSGSINLQALLDNISASAAMSAAIALPVESSAQSGNHSGSTTAIDDSVSHASPAAAKSPAPLPPAPANLPPRPPTQASPNDYALGSDLGQYHLHEQSAPPQKQTLHVATNLPPPGNLPPPQPSAGAPGTAGNGLPPPPLATFQQSMSHQSQPSPTISNAYRQRDPLERGDSPKQENDEEPEWNDQIQQLYDDFVAAERTYVSQGEWDKFPPNSRLFVGMHRPSRYMK